MSRADYVARYQRRKALRAKVEKAWLDEPQRPGGQLDSSMKKHTTLLNRLKTSLLIGPAETLIHEIDGLTLSKYLEEIVAAVVEGASRGKGDVDVAVDIVVHLHTRLTPEFLPQLLHPAALLGILIPTTSVAGKDADKDKEDKERLARQKLVLRIVAELAMAGGWVEGVTKGAAEVTKILKAFMTGDPQFSNMPLLSYFLKHLAGAYLGPDPSTEKTGLIEDDMPENVEDLVPAESQKNIRDLFQTYFNNASKTLVKGQLKLLEQDKRNHEAYIRSGEIFEDRQHAYERMAKAVERLTTGVQTMADLLALTPPTLPTTASLNKGGLQIVEGQSSFVVRDDGEGGGIWDDDEEQRFYEDLLDLKQTVPSALLGIKEKTKGTKADAVKGQDTVMVEKEDDAVRAEAQKKREEEEIQRLLEQVEQSESTMDNEDPQVADSSETNGLPSAQSQLAIDPLDDPLEETYESAEPLTASSLKESKDMDDGLQPGPHARLNAIFAALPEASNREMVDKLAVDFAFLNSKAARKRLVAFIGAVPKTRTDLLPHYSRLIATLNPYMPDIGTGVLEILEEETRYLQRKRLIRELDSVRLKNVRFWGELAKFKVAKPYAILHVLKVFLDDFRANIENISNLLETCGRFLLRYEGTAATAKSMVELMRRKQANSHLDQRHLIMLENAFYMCNPPERVVRQIIELTPMQSFIQYLLHDVLMKRTVDKVVKLFRKLHWEEQEVRSVLLSQSDTHIQTYDYILMTFTHIWEIKYENIEYAASVVCDLQKYHPEFSIAVVDQVLEDIRVGMEENIFKYNQRRIASVKYLGELYMYRVIGAQIILDTLWILISFGHQEAFPVPGRDSPIDSVTDFFRVRLVCTLLDSCGICFSKGSLKRKMDNFLVFFQLYVVCKVETPMDVEFMLSDTFETLRPSETRLKTFADAAAAVDIILAVQTEEVDDSISEVDSEIMRPPIEDPPLTSSLPTAQSQIEKLEEDDTVVLLRDPHQKDEMDLELQEEFEREFSKMLVDPGNRSGERKAPPLFDAAVPHIRKGEPGLMGQTDDTVLMENEGTIQFTFLAKKGGRQQMRPLQVPTDSNIAINLRSHQERSKAEQEHLKRLVLQNERRQELSEIQSLEQERKGGIRWKYVPRHPT
ncbi:hypothetical protein M231_05274 [Tremella mesenterica]|uniref:MIF4G domain-containing protein n=1 Tax=Tremella mesenterica TaxID=5217 RepID=A0A4Q1BIH1_TREME|nr:hypothetical protein M231_05274 [Tremella mesenterica]